MNGKISFTQPLDKISVDLVFIMLKQSQSIVCTTKKRKFKNVAETFLSFYSPSVLSKPKVANFFFCNSIPLSTTYLIVNFQKRSSFIFC